MDRAAVLSYVGKLGGTADNPFTKFDDTLVLRHADTGRWFGLMLEVPPYFYGGDAETALNLKCPPEIGYLLKDKYKDIKPAYHMNKEHWITVRLNGSIPDGEIKKLLKLSFDITEKRKK